MLILDISNLKKYYGDRRILDIKDLKVYSGDKIGLVGLNGSGKTTLLDLIANQSNPDEGLIKPYIQPFYIKQLEDDSDKEIDNIYISKFGLKGKTKELMSGGELTRLKIAKFLTDNPKFLLADEPTSNLDFEGINLLVEKLSSFGGSMIITSHDRDLLDKVCSKIIELEDGKIKVYAGNYSDYKMQKKLEDKNKRLEYQKYVKEKRRLEEVMTDTKIKIGKTTRPPKRMGNSEARLHRMGGQKSKKKLDNKVKAIASRLDKLEIKENIRETEKIKVDILGNEIFSKIVIEAKNINKVFGNRILFNNSDFQIYNKSKVALIGNNGSGKTTLLKMILERSNDINISEKANIGYFSQSLNILDENKTIIENLVEDGRYKEVDARNMLARFLFKRDDVYKKVGVLSGGERVKVSLAKILISDFNILILDEPTNYLDIYSIEVVEKALLNYGGTLIFVSHDRRLVESLADTIMYIENDKVNIFKGTFSEFQNRKSNMIINHKDFIYEKEVLENRLSYVIGLLSTPSKNQDMDALDLEYKELLKQLKNL
jgi:macrolide transport system ATP-binding/permease protein